MNAQQQQAQYSTATETVHLSIIHNGPTEGLSLQSIDWPPILPQTLFERNET
jgi:hypothetical protein